MSGHSAVRSCWAIPAVTEEFKSLESLIKLTDVFDCKDTGSPRKVASVSVSAATSGYVAASADCNRLLSDAWSRSALYSNCSVGTMRDMSLFIGGVDVVFDRRQAQSTKQFLIDVKQK
jgi:hypothetical protein